LNYLLEALVINYNVGYNFNLKDERKINEIPIGSMEDLKKVFLFLDLFIIFFPGF